MDGELHLDDQPGAAAEEGIDQPMLNQLFEFAVTDPEKRGKEGKLDLTYWTYTIHTKTSLPTFQASQFVCQRRYNSFHWLREHLTHENPGALIPPIPEKTLKGTLEKLVDVNALPLLEYRQRALRKFLVRVGAHPILYKSPLFQAFLEMGEADWAAKQKEVEKQPKPHDFAQSATEFKFGFMRMLKGDETRTTASQWEEPRAYVVQLQHSLTMLKERIELLVKRRKATASSLDDFGKSFLKVGEIEKSYGDGPLPKALTEVGHHSEHLCKVYHEQANMETTQVVETLSYYTGLCQSILDVIKSIQDIELTRDSLADQVAKLERKAQEKAGDQGRVQVDLNNAQQKRDAAIKALEAMEQTLQSELVRFHREKQYDVKQMLKAFVDLQMEFSEKMKTSWESVLPTVQAIPTGTS